MLEMQICESVLYHVSNIIAPLCVLVPAPLGILGEFREAVAEGLYKRPEECTISADYDVCVCVHASHVLKEVKVCVCVHRTHVQIRHITCDLISTCRRQEKHTDQ